MSEINFKNKSLVDQFEHWQGNWERDLRLLATKEAQLKIAVEKLEAIKKFWDISNPGNVIPATLAGEKYPNDSMAAYSIITAIKALEEIEKMGKE